MAGPTKQLVAQLFARSVVMTIAAAVAVAIPKLGLVISLIGTLDS